MPGGGWWNRDIVPLRLEDSSKLHVTGLGGIYCYAKVGLNGRPVHMSLVELIKFSAARGAMA